MFFPNEIPTVCNDQVEQSIVKTEPDEIHQDPALSTEEDHGSMSAHEDPIVSFDEDPLGSVKLEPLDDDQVIVKQEPDEEPEAKKVKTDSIIVPLFVINQKQFSCDECSAVFSSKVDKNAHLQSQHNVIFHYCKDCKKAFSSEDEFKNHQHDSINAIAEDGNLQCEHCQKFFQSMSVLRGHYLRQHNKTLSAKRPKPPGNVPCTQCERIFNSKESLKYHIKSVHEGFKAPCDICGKHFTVTYLKSHKEKCGKPKQYIRLKPNEPKRKAKLQEHLKTCSEKKCISCELCLAKFTQEKYPKHKTICELIETIQEDSFECKACNKNFSRKDNITRHIESVHLKLKNHLCSDCGKEFSEKAALVRHASMHHGNVRYPCHLCDKSYGLEKDLRSHIKVMHENLSYTCVICNKAFSQKSNLDKHILEIHEGRKVKCEFCEKQLSSTSMKRHIEVVHHGIKYPCNLCNGLFSNLTKHMNEKHNRDGNGFNQCPKCSKIFSRKENLNRHILEVHSKKITCDLCLAMITEEKYLEHRNICEHIEVIHEDGFGCKTCQRPFSRKDTLTRHIEKIHLKILKNEGTVLIASNEVTNRDLEAENNY